MSFWDKHWFGPVAAIRPYLFQKCFLMVVAFDLLVLMIERGGRYGLDTMPFNVPHFRWLDSFHRLFLTNGVPDATYYVAVLVLTSFLSFYLIFTGHRSWLMAIVCVLYTYAWSMSRLDSYLHHYMLSLILFCMIFFPAIDGRVFKNWIETHTESKKRTSKKSDQATPRHPFSLLAVCLIILAVVYRIALSQTVSLTTIQRWGTMFAFAVIVVALVWTFRKSLTAAFERSGSKAGPTVGSWAVRLLGTTVGVIYIFTSIAKMDAEWCGGHTLQQVGTTADVLLPVEQIATSVGISRDWFWASLATFVIPLELALAAMYLVSVRQDEEKRNVLPSICFVGWLLAVGLHLNNEMMNLIIQWFGYYMLLLATIFLLPASALLVLGTMFYWPESWLRDWYDNSMRSWSNSQASIALGFASVFALVSLIGFGFLSYVMGGIIASFLLTGGLVILLVYGLIAGWERKSLLISLGTLAAGASMSFAVSQCSATFDYYDGRGKTLQQLGDNEGALREMEIARDLKVPTAEANSELHTNLGLSYARIGQWSKAEKSYKRAILLNPRQFLAHYSLGNLLVKNGQPERAEPHYRKAIAIKGDFSDAYINLGNVLEFKNQLPGAIQCYEIALDIEKDAADIKQMLEAARAKLATADK